jgi:hypothetical protein
MRNFRFIVWPPIARVMRVLLDDCVGERLRHLVTEYDCQTVRYAGFAGLTKRGSVVDCRIGCFRCAHDGRSEHPGPANPDRPTDLGANPSWSHNRLSDLSRLSLPLGMSMRPGQVVRVRE